jgi:DNA-binding NarL/FixJ family response regulator
MLGRIRVLLVEDHALVREALFMRLSAERDIEIIGQAADIPEAEAAMEKQLPDVVLLDFVLGEGDPLHIIPSWNQRFRSIRVVILTASHNGEIARRALQAGASGFVCKTDSFSELLAVVRKASKGRVALTPAVQEILGEGQDSGLSDRELQALRLIAAGKATREIATILGISVKTAERHRENIKQKLGTETGAALMREAVLRFPAE